MKYEISADRKSLTIVADDDEQAMLREMDEKHIHADSTLFDWFEWLICNSELAWVNPADTGDLTSAPMLGILGEQGVKDITVFQENFGYVECGSDGRNTFVQPILERWAFMDYQVRSALQDLRDHGKVVFTA